MIARRLPILPATTRWQLVAFARPPAGWPLLSWYRLHSIIDQRSSKRLGQACH